MSELNKTRLNDLATKIIDGTVTSEEEMEFQTLYTKYREQCEQSSPIS
ncbi:MULTISPECIES: hypothetical protein [unclassified Thalassotalea]|nr:MULTISPECIES: hypothetical protein [unclassified Thalassotalea]NMP17278.1 hypothetical protein [Thalassotalea sp. Y01]